MVGIVVVSHSHALGDAVVALAREMVPDAVVRIEVAAGLDDNTFGTDAVAIAEAITAADSGEGVLVIMDIGSAILSAELALEMLDDDLRSRVELSPAPLVEGLLAAAVAAAGDADLPDVAAEARSGLAGKAAQLGDPGNLPETLPTTTEESAQPSSLPLRASSNRRGVEDVTGAEHESAPADAELGDPAPAGSGPAGVVRRFVLTSPHGLHARPAARLARLVAGLAADVRLRNLTTGKDWVSARSLSKIATLGALRGHELEISAAGPDAQTALDSILDLARKNFGDPVEEPDQPAAPNQPAPGSRLSPLRASSNRRGVESDALSMPMPGPTGEVPRLLHGLPAAPGTGMGPALLLIERPIEVREHTTGSPADEQRRLDRALAAAARQLQALQADTANLIGADEAGIFEAQLALLDDPELLAAATTQIAAGESAETAWASVMEDVAHTLAQLDDDYLRARAADVREVCDQVLRALAGVDGGATADDLHNAGSSTPAAPSVLIAQDLTGAQAAHLDPTATAAVALAASSPTSHAAILVRARGIPLVVAAGSALLAIPAGSDVAVNGDTGEIQINPDAEARQALLDQAEQEEAERERATQSATRPARTTDGLQILVGANLGSLDDARAAADAGADLAGLVRTEFLFLDRATPPGVEEQIETYCALAEAIGGRRLTLRTPDVGGDKPLPYAPTPPSDNPFLGVRGLRLSLAQPALFRDQLRAIVRTAHQTPVSVMFPMVSTLSELHTARRLLEEVIAAEGQGTPTGLEVGIMVEVPAVALKAAEFATAVDFFSIGTNDLTQYALAAERGNPDVAAIGDSYDPGVLALIRAVCRGAAGGPHVAVCGDLAGDPRSAPLLVGLGVGTLSMSSPAIPLVKRAVRAVDSTHAADLATAAIAMPGAAEVRTLLLPDPEASSTARKIASRR